MSSTGKYVFLTEEEFIASDRIAGLTYVLNLTAQIITIVLCLLLFQIIWPSDLLTQARLVFWQWAPSFSPLPAVFD